MRDTRYIFRIPVFGTAESIQQYEHIRKSSALLVVRELSNIEQSSFSILFLSLLYTSATVSF